MRSVHEVRKSDPASTPGALAPEAGPAMAPLVSHAAPCSAPAPAYAHLIRLHRHSLIHLLLVGGTASERAGLALAFHRGSPLRRGPFVRLRGRRDEGRLRCAVECALCAVKCGRPDSPLLESEGGTLFVDHVEHLTLATQRVLLSFLGSLSPPQGAPAAAWFGRLAVGSAEPLEAAAAAGRFLPALHDILDKIRVELPPGPRSGIQ